MRNLSIFVKIETFLACGKKRPTGTKWADLCKREEAFKVSPDKLVLKEEGAVKITPKKKKSKVISVEGQKELKESFKRFEKKVQGKKTKAPFYVFETSKEKVFVVAADVETKNVLFHNLTNTNYHFYNVEKETFKPFIKEKHKDGKEILWPVEA